MSCHFHMLRKRRAAQKATVAAQNVEAAQPKADTAKAVKTAEKASQGRKKAPAKEGGAK